MTIPETKNLKQNYSEQEIPKKGNSEKEPLNNYNFEEEKSEKGEFRKGNI